MRLLFGLLIGLGCFVGLFVWSELSNWRGETSKIELSLVRTSEAIARHADDILEMSRLSLASLLTEISDEEEHPEAGSKLDMVIRRQMQASSTLDALTYVDEDGEVVASSLPNASQHNVAGTDYFRFHRLSSFRLPVLGRPYRMLPRHDGYYLFLSGLCKRTGPLAASFFRQ